MLSAERIAAARSLLFVPGDRPDRFDRAARSGADAVILDLEDGVPRDRRVQARREVVSWMDAGNPALVRINPVGTAEYGEDVAALSARPRAVMLAKAEQAADLARVRQDLPSGTLVVPVVETPRGVLGIRDLCAMDGVVRVAFGNVDLAAELGIDPAARDAFAYTRSKLVLASAAAGLAAPIDGVSTRIDDVEQLMTQARYACDMGFGGKLCIHPRQVEHVNEAFSPDALTVAWATRIIEQASSGGAELVDGEMVDAPVLRRAHAILRVAVPGEASGMLDPTS